MTIQSVTLNIYTPTRWFSAVEMLGKMIKSEIVLITIAAKAKSYPANINGILLSSTFWEKIKKMYLVFLLIGQAI